MTASIKKAVLLQPKRNEIQNMKKKTILVVATMLLLTGTVKAQMFDFSQNLKDLTIGLNLGCVGYDFNGRIDKTYAGFGVGANISILGLYIDFIYQNPEHRYDRKITFTEYPDNTALTINLGYKIPVTPWMNLTPLIGYSNETSGVTLGNSIGVESQNHRIFHDYRRDAIYNHFNYGVGLSFKPIRLLEIGGVVTSHAVYGNISFNFFGKK